MDMPFHILIARMTACFKFYEWFKNHLSQNDFLNIGSMTDLVSLIATKFRNGNHFLGTGVTYRYERLG